MDYDALTQVLVAGGGLLAVGWVMRQIIHGPR